MKKGLILCTFTICMISINAFGMTAFEKGEVAGRLLSIASLNDLYFERCQKDGFETNIKFDLTVAVLRDELNLQEEVLSDLLPSTRANAKTLLERILNEYGGCGTDGGQYMMEVLNKNYKRTIEKIRRR